MALEYLDLSNNHITKLEGLTKLVNLQSLYLQNNKIIGLSIFIFLDVITSKINSKIIYNLNDIFGNIFNFPKKYFRYYY